MPNYICKTCGTQFAESEQPPANCPICEDPRQYIGWNGQQWTTLDELKTNLQEVIELCLEETREAKKDIPHFVGLQTIEVSA